jgi:hypothetical protein
MAFAIYCWDKNGKLGAKVHNSVSEVVNPIRKDLAKSGYKLKI